MSRKYILEELSFNDLKEDVNRLSWTSFRLDLFAGFTVALLTLPQAMAYALVAGLPLSCGLLSAIYSSMIASLCGSSRHLVTGPTNAIAILIQLGTVQILDSSYRDIVYPSERNLLALQVLTQISFLVGAFQVLAAWWGLGRLTQFVSYSVITGYMLGTAIAVIVGQLFTLLGVHPLIGAHSVYENAVYLVTHVLEMQWTTVFIGSLSVLLLLVLPKVNKKIPIGLVTFIVVAALVEFLGLSSYSASSLLAPWVGDEGLPNVLVVGDTGEIHGLVPSVGMPFFNMRIINGVLPVAFAISLLSVMDSVSVAKSLAANTGQRLSVNQEIFGLGLGNLVSSFIGAMPISGSPTRSGLNYRTGAQTRFATILNACFVSLFVWVLGFFVTRIPLTALSALVIVTVHGVVNTRQIWFCTRATAADAFVLWSTVLACLFFSLDIAFYFGVILSITLYLKKAAIPILAEYEIDEIGELKGPVEPLELKARPIRVIKVEGELFFGAADLFQSTLKSIATDDTTTRVIILQLKNARDMDATTCLVLKQLYEYLKSTGRSLVACGITPHVWDVLVSSDLASLIGKENLFVFDPKAPNLHMQKAFQRALQLSHEAPCQPPLEILPETVVTEAIS